MEIKHTPGPWIQSHRIIPNNDNNFYATQVYTKDGRTICTLSWYPKPKDENGVIATYREANAKLIAAAPELLEALQLVRTYMTAHIPEKIFNIVDTAIQKATSNA